MGCNKIIYSNLELLFAAENKLRPQKEAYLLFLNKFGRTNVSFNNYKALCKRNGWKTGRTGCFKKGSVPANKGKKQAYNANSAKTQFKSGNKPHNTKFSGYESLTKDGYVQISVDEINPHTGYERRQVLKHRHLWEQKNGKIPNGFCLKCLDSNKQNTDPENWECIPVAMLPRLNGVCGRNYDKAAAEIKPTIMAVTKLEHKTRETKKG